MSIEKLDETQADNTFYAALNAVGNHEAKALVASVLATEDAPFTGTDLDKVIKLRQQGHDGWVLGKGTALNYCRSSFAPAGLVESNNNAPLRYESTPIGRTFGLAMQGAVMEWSLDNPQESIQTLFSLSQGANAYEGPIRRYLMYRAILGEGNVGVGYQEINQRINNPNTVADHTVLKSVVWDGVSRNAFDIKTRSDEYNPRFALTDYKLSKNAKSATYLPITRAIQAGIDSLQDEPDSIVTLNDLVAAAQRFAPDFPSSDIRYQLVQFSRSTKHFPGIQMLPEDEQPATAEVRIADDLALPLSQLVDSLESIRTGDQREIARYQSIGRLIVGAPAHFATLMKKAQSFSPYSRSSVSGKLVHDHVQDVLKDANRPLTVTEVQKLMVEAGQPYRRAAVGRAVAQLLRDEILCEKPVQRKAGNKHLDRAVFIP